MVLACAEHGASILLEKPMCRTLAEADEMVNACERHHVKLAICHQTRYGPKIKVARDQIASGGIGKLLELRGRGKEDTRGGGEDLWVLGTHIFDLMRLLGGEPKRCFARLFEGGRPARRSDVREGNEGIGPLAGDRVEAMFELEGGVCAYFSSHRGAAGNPSRYGLTLHGSRGVLEMGTGYLPPMKILEDPSWSPGRTGSRWLDVSTAGVGKPEVMEDLGLDGGNVLIARDLIAAIGADRQPMGSVYEARAATEMIVAVFASHCRGRPVELPLADRGNPLLSDF
jgi:predicted dehydrogenase